MANTTVVEQPRETVLLLGVRDVVRILVAGLIVGLITAAVYALLDKYVFTPALCGHETIAVGRCASKSTYASALAMVLGALAGLFAMVQLRVFRPLLVVLFATISLWNIILLTGFLPWWGVVLVMAGLFLVAYGAFAWTAQLKSLPLAVVIGIVLTLVVRIVLMV